MGKTNSCFWFDLSFLPILLWLCCKSGKLVVLLYLFSFQKERLPFLSREMNNLNSLWNWFKSGIHCPWSYKGNSTNQSLFPKTSAWTPVPLMHCWYFTHVAFNYMEIHYASQCGMVIPQTRTAESRVLSWAHLRVCSLQEIYLKRCKSRAAKILKDSTHPSNHLLFTAIWQALQGHDGKNWETEELLTSGHQAPYHKPSFINPYKTHC